MLQKETAIQDSEIKSARSRVMSHLEKIDEFRHFYFAWDRIKGEPNDSVIFRVTIFVDKENSHINYNDTQEFRSRVRYYRNIILAELPIKRLELKIKNYNKDYGKNKTATS